MIFDINKIKELVKEDKVQWSGHVLKRMSQRGIKIKDIILSIANGEIIEQYSDDYPYPSCLILGFSDSDKGIHIVCAIEEYNIWMITAYYPDESEWLEDLKTRRR